jgi:hypothetical protein
MPITWTETLVGTASLLGSRFPVEEVGCQVYACTQSSLNIMNGKGNLCTLVAHPVQLHPLSAVVTLSRGGSSFLSLKSTEKETVYINSQGIFFQSGQWISLQKAKRMPSKLESPSMENPIDWSRVYERIEILDNLQRRKPTQLIISSILEKQDRSDRFPVLFSNFVSMLFDGFSHQNLVVALKATKGLLGLGPGSTPSGDDFLCGFLLLLKMLAVEKQSFPIAFPPSFSVCYLKGFQKLLCGSNLTTAISRQFLSLGCAGLFSQSLVMLGKSFVYPQSDDVSFIESLRLLNTMGHSSGYDAATGLLLGLLMFMPDSVQRGSHEFPVLLCCCKHAG